MENVKEWKNRIVKTGEANPEQLLAHPRNWRFHPKHQQEAMGAALGGVGWVRRVMVNLRTSEAWAPGERGVETLVDGHMRVGMAIARNEPTVPVDFVDLSPAEEAAVLATLDPIGAMAGTDKENLADILGDAAGISQDLDTLLAEVAATEGIVGASGAPGADRDPDERVEVGEELLAKWGTRQGDVWTIGPHRLACGDSLAPTLDGGMTEAALGGRRAAAVFTDPPYNVDLAGVKLTDRPRAIANDAMTSEQYAAFCARIADILERATDGCVYVCHASGPEGRTLAGTLDRRLHYSTTIVWVKDAFTIGLGKYQNSHEPIWFGRAKRKAPRQAEQRVEDIPEGWAATEGTEYQDRHGGIWFGWTKDGKRFIDARTLGNVWSIPRPRASAEHPTMKPVELVATAIAHSTRPGDLVFDPFLGSGTTMVAAHRIGRRAAGVELEPAYCAVILERMQALYPMLPIAREKQGSER